MSKKESVKPEFKENADGDKETGGATEHKSIMTPEEMAKITAEIRGERKRRGENAPF